jgi:hypothetical protein
VTLEDASPPLDTDATIYAFRRNVVVAASAGTGKTYRLTALYVLLALGLTSMGQPDAGTPAPPLGPERIVATTFSRAAAAEIAARVERALREIAGWDGQAGRPPRRFSDSYGGEGPRISRRTREGSDQVSGSQRLATARASGCPRSGEPSRRPGAPRGQARGGMLTWYATF